MKFESFCKKYMPYVGTVEMDGKKWAYSNGVYMLLGNDAGTIGKVSKSDPTLDTILNVAEWGERCANLQDAHLRRADGKASDIVRGFFDGRDWCNISNAHFGLIEKADMLFIAEWSDGEKEKYVHALLIGQKVPDVDDFEPTGIILEMEE